MPMNPRTYPRGARPDFALPKPNPDPDRITDALWWLVQMRLLLEPRSENGGVLAIKPGYHSYGSRLPDHGPGDPDTDHSIRRAPDRRGQWWEDFAAAHDWTFDGAHTGDYTEINLYMRRVMTAMRSLTDLRPDDVYAYVIGQLDGDRAVEGWNEYKDEPETGDDSHLWHIHYSFRRDIVGSFWHMWKALTIDMGWTYAEWQRSTREDDVSAADVIAALKSAEGQAAVYAAVNQDRVQAYDTDPSSLKQVVRKPTAADNGLMTWASALTFAVRNTDLLVRLGLNTGVKVDALAAALATIAANVVEDDADLEAIRAKIDEARAGTVADIRELLGGTGQTDEQVAAALRAALGDRATAVGQLLAA